MNDSHTDSLQARRGLRQGDPISPMLFVIVMEYLHRSLEDLKTIPNFNFHSKCEKLGLVDMSFVDELLLFSRGDVISVQLVMDRFNAFSEATGFFVNPAKCNHYGANIDDSTMLQLTNLTGFSIGSLPFRYLGLPLSSKKLNNSQSLALVEKIGARINHWSSHLLSYAGQL